MHDLIYRYWGKSQYKKKGPSIESDTQEELSGDKYHLLVYHCLDVAACGHVLLSDKYPWAKNIADQLGIPVEQFRRIFVFFLLLHDIGKFSRAFQGLAPDLSPDLVPAVAGMPYSERHDSLGYWLWKDSKAFRFVLSEALELSLRELRFASQLDIWFKVVTGHHGQPPEDSSKPLRQYFTDEDINTCCQFIQEATQGWLTEEDLHWLKDDSHEEKIQVASWQMAGVAVLADWTGSDQQHFSYCSKPMPLKDYWQNIALQQAEKACQQSRLFSLKTDPFHSIDQLFDFIKTPTPLQQYAVDVPLAEEPQLFLLEDVTGAGKTEAAMVLVHRLMAKGLAKGLYVGLPTMATANAMYDRLSQCYQKLYTGDQPASLVLSHGARHLSDAFTESVALSEQIMDQNYQKDELSASAYCNAWLADSRKKALLADVGVGTIDQALLSILPARHQSLRLLGLVGKVLLIDEVHAYDSYMQKLLESLLQMHAQQGGCAILLSATLPQSMKTKLVAAYARGRKQSFPGLTNNLYPLVTQYPFITECQQHIATRKEVARTVSIERLDDYDQVNQQIGEALEAGKSICWIRNTVDNARDSHSALQEMFVNHQERIHLFHSRFAMQDRQRIEGNVLEWFGKKSTAEMRKGRLLVSSQVVENSLDLDFDIMITDLAPIDSLIQRAGRLHRHVRDNKGNILPEGQSDKRAPPELSLFAPEPSDQADNAWLQADSFRGSAAVYQDLGILWRSARVLLDKGEYSMPDDARHLIDSVYSDEDMLPTPQKIEEASFEADGKRRAEGSMANFNKLDLEEGYTQDSNSTGWKEEVNIPTRLSDETISVVLVVRGQQGDWQPYAGQIEHAWDLSTVKIREKLWRQAEELMSPKQKKEMEQLQEQNQSLRWLKPFPLEGDLADCYSTESGWLGIKIPADAGNV